MERQTRSSSKPVTTTSERRLSEPNRVVKKLSDLNLNTQHSKEIINHWEWRILRFTLFRMMATVAFLLSSIPWPRAKEQLSSNAAFEKLAPHYYIAGVIVLLLLLIAISHAAERFTDSRSEVARTDWLDTVYAETHSYYRVAIALVLVHVAHRYVVPLSNAWVIGGFKSACQLGPVLDLFKTTVDKAGIFLLSSAVAWVIPNRVALLQPATFRGTAILVLFAALLYALCYAGVSAATLKAWQAFGFQAAKDGKCAGEIALRIVDLVNKVGGKNFARMDSMLGWTMGAMGLGPGKE